MHNNFLPYSKNKSGDNQVPIFGGKASEQCHGTPE